MADEEERLRRTREKDYEKEGEDRWGWPPTARPKFGPRICYVTMVMDLWTSRAGGWYLCTEEGDLWDQPSIPILHKAVQAAYHRTMTPCIVKRPTLLQDDGDWASYTTEVMPEDLEVLGWKDGEVYRDGVLWLSEAHDAPLRVQWRRHLDTQEALDAAMAAGVRYGSGLAILHCDPLGEPNYSPRPWRARRFAKPDPLDELLGIGSSRDPEDES